MTRIKPITDLRKTNEISDLAHQINEPIFITKNGYGDLVVMSNEVYDNLIKATKEISLKEASYPFEEKQDEHFGFVKVACASIDTSVASPKQNAKMIINKVKECAEKGVKLLVFPELSLSSYTCGDLFLQRTLLDACEEGLKRIIKETKNLNMVFIVGAPVVVEQKLYNAAIVILKGKILGIVPKTAIPNYNEFYELRHFEEAPKENMEISYLGHKTIFGNKLIFRCLNSINFTFGVEICEDLWIPNSPSINHSLMGATIICNLSASNETAGKDEYRTLMVKAQSGKLACAYLYSSAGNGESTTDIVFSSANMISENGTLLKKAELFKNETIISDIDVEKLASDRQRITSFKREYLNGYNVIGFYLPLEVPSLDRKYSSLPFIPKDENERTKRMGMILKIQVMGLVKRLNHIHCDKIVIGLSGGLDSTLALLVCYEAFKELGYDYQNIKCLTMPCFGTSARTKKNAYNLANALGVSIQEIDITEAVKIHLKDIGHDETTHDVAYENAQARERTQILMDYANKINGLVIGTGDLSELALGFATYNGDHMSNYGVNGSIPKTLVRYLVYHYALSHVDIKDTLLDIIDTPVSPELLPPKEGVIAQKTEDIIGPYELHDFFIYHLLRNKFSIKKLFFIACNSFEGIYDKDTIKKWLKVFIRRFFTQQFKRSCLPDGVKVGFVSLSPRGDFRMPSDASYEAWMDEIESL